MKEICSTSDCTACSACMNICPKDAISMEEDGCAGYVYPKVNADRCIDCELCKRICPTLNPPNLRTPLTAYAARSKDDAQYMASASGGAAYAFASVILAKGGVVYGCEMKSWCTIVHQRYETLDSAGRMRGSKYVQSSLGFSMRNVQKDLEQGRQVLFTGTPCQVAGLRRYLRKEYDNLYSIDLVCHGVPSQKLLRDNVESMCHCYGQTPTDSLKVWFREKSRHTSANANWLRYGVFLSEHAIPVCEQELPKNDYISAFMSGLIFRDSCYKCPYAQEKRCGDVTVADYWGLKSDCKVPHPAGISLLLPTTEKGMQLISETKDRLCIEERTVGEAVNGNGQLLAPSRMPLNRPDFFNDYKTIGQLAYKKHLKAYRKSIIHKKIRRLLSSWLSRIPYLKKVYRLIRRR